MNIKAYLLVPYCNLRSIFSILATKIYFALIMFTCAPRFMYLYTLVVPSCIVNSKENNPALRFRRNLFLIS